jgi:hypothetical protein
MRLDESNKLPRARPEGLIVQKVADEAVIYDLETKEAHCLKPLAAFVFDASDGSTTIGKLAIRARAEVDPEVTDEQVADAVVQLEQIRLLEAPSLLVIDGNGGVSRRDMMRRMGYAGAAATVGTGLVMSITAPAALAACSGQPAGCACGQNKECASGHCCKTAGSNDKCNNGCCSETNNGADCQCQANGMCASIPTPPNGAGCCNATVCTGTGGTVCSAAAPTQSTLSSPKVSGASGGGNLTPGASGGGVTPTAPTGNPTSPGTGTTPTNGGALK